MVCFPRDRDCSGGSRIVNVYYKELATGLDNLAVGFLLGAMCRDYTVKAIHDPTLDCLIKATMPDGTVIRSTVEYERWKHERQENEGRA
jgi:hypothetical protein